MYQVQLHYKDNESLNIEVSDEDIQKFFDDLNNARVFVHPVSKVGFWTSVSDIRYIKVVPVAENEVSKNENPSDEEKKDSPAS